MLVSSQLVAGITGTAVASNRIAAGGVTASIAVCALVEICGQRRKRFAVSDQIDNLNNKREMRKVFHSYRISPKEQP